MPNQTVVLAALVYSMLGLPATLSERLQALGLRQTDRVIVVRVKDQKLLLFENGRLKKEYPVSTAQNGVGERVDSYQTPLGLHRVKEKLGAKLPPGAILENREFKGELWIPPATAERSEKTGPAPGDGSKTAAPALPDLITSRILWLEGLEPGRNAGSDKEGRLVDSYQRFIYIHGTNHEAEVGKPTSRGCVRMKNAEVIQLFDLVEEGDLVWIEE